MANIHATAIVSPTAELADDVEIGPYVIIEGEVTIGEGTLVGPHVHLVGPMTIGRGNRFFTSSALGLPPQDLHFGNERSSLEIGEENIFREYVTIHRATGEGEATRIGSRNMFMACSHVGHNATVGNDCVFVNSSLAAGHSEVHDGVIISGNSAIGQFVRVGRLAMVGGTSGAGYDIPPFMILMEINQIAGFNRIGLQRAGIEREAISAIRRAFRRLYKEGLTVPVAVARIEQEHGHIPEIQEVLTFVRESKRGIAGRAGGRLRDLRRAAARHTANA